MEPNPYTPTEANLDTSAVKEDVSEEMEARRVIAYRAFADDDEYVTMWRPLLAGEKTRLPFNWYAAIFTAGWCAYRKMYWLAAGVYLSSMIAGFIGGVIYVLVRPDRIDALQGPDALWVGFFATLFIIRIPLGLFANRLYYRKASKAIQKTIDQNLGNNEEILARIAKLGGINPIALGVVIVLNIVVNFWFR